MTQATAMKLIGSPTASARMGDPIFDEDWPSSVDTGAWFEMVDGSNVEVRPVESEEADGTSFRKILFDEHKNV